MRFFFLLYLRLNVMKSLELLDLESFYFFWFSSSLFKSFPPKTAQNMSLFEIHN